MAVKVLQKRYAERLRMLIEMMSSNGTNNTLQFDVLKAGSITFKSCDEKGPDILDEAHSTCSLHPKDRNGGTFSTSPEKNLNYCHIKKSRK